MRGFRRGRIVIKQFSRCIAFFVLCSGFVHAQNKLSLQPYHWVFDYANELLLRNQVPMAGWATQPLNFGDMAQVLESNVPGKYADFLSNRIAQHLYGYARSGERQLENPILQMGALFIEKHGSMVGNDRFLSSVRWFSGLRFSENLTIFNAIDVDQNFGNDKAYLGKSWRDITALTEQAYIKYQTQKVQIKFGRDYIRWGRGYDAALAVSDASRPFDQLFFQLRSRQAQFSYFISKLNSLKLFTSADSIQEAWVDRYMSGGRIELYLFGNRVQLALSQFILWGGAHGMEFYYLNPFVIYHGEQLNEDPEIRGNSLGLFDFAWFPRKRMEVYGQVLIDDFQIDSKEPADLEPSEVGIMLGTRYADPAGIDGLTLGVEYTRVTNRTYNTMPEAEKYVHRNKPVGHFLGNDFDRWIVYGTKFLPCDLLVNAHIDIRRHGEGRVDGEFDTPWMAYDIDEGYDEPFPSGLVEYSQIYELGLRWHPKSFIYLSLIGRAGNVLNFDNRHDEMRIRRELYLKLWFEWSRFWEI